MTALPEALALAVGRALADIDGRDLARAAARLSARYRAGPAHAAGRDEILAYLATRLPATYAAAATAFAALSERLPDFQPASLLDLGAGPATAGWAALAAFASIGGIDCIENAPQFRQIGAALAAGGPPPLAAARWIAGDLEAPDLPMADLVVASFALAELSDPARPRLIAAAWAASRQALVLIEPGTPAGFARIAAARARLISAGAAVVAPCPHQSACPLLGTEDWCHRAIRLPRSRTHRAAKGARLGWEDEKFSWVAFGRSPPPPGAARLLYPPRIGKAEIQAFCCEPDGTARWRHIPARDRTAFKAARKWRWGDLAGDGEP